MTTPPKTMAEIRDVECGKHGYAMEKKYNQIELANMPSIIMDASFKAGFDCRDKLDNEALNIAIKALEQVDKYWDTSDVTCIMPAFENEELNIRNDNLAATSIIQAKEILAEIRKLTEGR